MPINSIRNKCDFLIAIDVSAIPEVTPKELTNTLEVFTRSLRLTMKQQRSVNLNEVDLFICPKKLSSFNIFEMNSLGKMFEIGYNEAQKMIPMIHKQVNTKLRTVQ